MGKLCPFFFFPCTTCNMLGAPTTETYHEPLAAAHFSPIFPFVFLGFLPFSIHCSSRSLAGMVTGVGNRREEDGNKTAASLPKIPAGGGPSSWGTPAFSGGQSASTSGSAGSPSSRSEPTAATPASESTFVRLNHLDIHGDDAGSSQGAVRSGQSLCPIS